ncbi:MAG TPA: UvrB/UvrC motif-containing protein [Patescibacteria group bacterium]|nr:UvrB/UvrC motif-containing protein [Patescibacteria group bacterium]
MIWVNFLHIYQPPTQKPEILEKVVKESYRKVFAGLKKIPSAKVTLNISAALTELLVKYGYDDVIATIRELAEKGQIEFTGSAKYHPLLPRLPEEEIIRQVKLNIETNRKVFGDVFQPRGFFPPEMAFSRSVAEVVSKLGFEWIVADELSFNRNVGSIDYSKVYRVKGLPLRIFFREREISFKILSAQIGTGNMLIAELGKRINDERYLLTAMDGETFGHHRLGLEELLFDLYRSKRFRSVTISELPRLFPNEVEIEPLPSTWALMEKDLERNAPFSRWFDPDNPIHTMQWELNDLALSAMKQSDHTNEGYQRARELLDRSLHSDQYWWAGAKPWWSIEYIEAGAKDFLNAIFAVPGVTEETKQRAKDLYFRILSTAFDWQREGIVDRMAKKEDEEIRQRIDQNVPRMAKQEFDKMIQSLTTQMLAAAKYKEYERAAQFRNRIKELQGQREKIGT